MSDIKVEPVNTQPKSTVPMTAGGNKNALNCPVGPDGKRDWSYGLFDCFSACGLCCFAAWCPCIVWSRNRQRLRSLQYQGVALPAGSERTDEHCCMYCGLAAAGYGWVLQIRHREEIRERYGIRGSPFNDCFVSWCCRACSLTQERREIELEEGNFSAQSE